MFRKAPAQKAGAGPLTTTDAADRYLTWMRDHKKLAAGTIKSRRMTLDALCRYPDTPEHVRDLDHELLEEFMVDTYGERADSSFNTRRAQLGTWLRWLQDYGHLPNGYPLAKHLLRRKETKGKKHIIRRDRLDLAAAAGMSIHPRNGYMVRVAFKSVRRISELAPMTWGDWDETPSASYPHGELYYNNIKSRRDCQPLKVDREFAQILTEWRALYAELLGVEAVDPAWLMFPALRPVSYATKDTPVTMQLSPLLKIRDVGWTINAILDKAGINAPGMGWHAFRRGGACDYLDRFRPHDPNAIRLVMVMLDHQDQKTTETYLDRDSERERLAQLMEDTDPYKPDPDEMPVPDTERVVVDASARFRARAV